MVNLHKLRLADGMGFPRLWNRLLDELSRNTVVSVASPLTLSQDSSGIRIGFIHQSPLIFKGIKWGTLTADYTGGETFTLQPSNEWGTALKDSTGATVATITCKVLASQGNPDLTKVYIGDGTVNVGCKLESGIIIPYVVAVDPTDSTKSVNLSLLTDENQVLAQWQFVAGKVQGKFYYHLGCRMSTVSDWVDVADLKFAIESAKLKLQAQMNGGSWVDVATTDTEESKVTSCDEPGA